MQFAALIFLCAPILIALFSRRLATEWRLRKLAKANGCKPVRQLRSRLPFALDLKWRVFQHRGSILDDVIFQVYRDQGTWIFSSDSTLDRSISAADPRVIQAILATHFRDWGLGQSRARAVGPLLGRGVFTSDGEVWQHARGVLRPQFTKAQVSDVATVERHVQALFAAMGAASPTNGWTRTRNLMPLLLRFTLDNTTDFLYGQSLHSQTHMAGAHEGSPEALHAASFEKAFTDANSGAQLRLKAGPFYWLFRSRAFVAACATWQEHGTRLVDAALGREKQENRYCFVDGLAESTDDRALMRDLSIQLLFAGEDTSASLLAFTLRCLALHPGAWDRLRREVLEFFGTQAQPVREVTFASLKECAPLQNVLKETLRLYPPVPMNAREALRDTVLPVGGGPDGNAPVAVAKGTVVKYSPYVMQRREDIWGPDALEWKPDRWVGRRVGWEYLPFNGGPRICIGQQFALTEIAYAVVRILQHFDDVQGGDFEPAISTTWSTALFPKHGVPLSFHVAAE
ncbi:hypothetical protein BFW01_g3802 [Lasiodiplodia theobromae]|nr:hypothetical protein BFW01_g3802 [Lasiodiplodia theobromae]